MQQERGPRKSKTPTTPTSKLPPPNYPYSQPILWYTKPSTSTLNPQHELASQILIVSIKQARTSPGFENLNRASQDIILGHLWAALFLLRAAYWPKFEHISWYLSDLEECLRRLRQLELDRLEVDLVETILVCRGDLLEEVAEGDLARRARDSAIRNLRVSTHLFTSRYRF